MLDLPDPEILTGWLSSSVDWALVNVLGTGLPLQLLLLLTIVPVALLLTRSMKPRIERWLSERHPRIRRAPLAKVALRHLGSMVFLLLVLCVLILMRSITWPSASYLLEVIARLLAAWLLIRFGSLLIRNPTFSRFVAVLAWTVVALATLDLLEPTRHLLDMLAIGIGSIRISASTLLEGVLTLALLIWGAVALSRVLDGWYSKNPDITPSVRVLLDKITRIVLISAAILAAIHNVGIDLTAFAVFSGAVGIGVGFGLQKVVSNLMSGMIILLDRSIKPGDVIELGETFGWVSSLGARYASVVTRDGKEFLIPNEELITQRVVNWSYSDRLVRLEIGIRAAYHNDPHLVRRIAQEAAGRPKRVVATPTPVCHLCEFGDSSLKYILRFWIEDPQNGVINITGEVLLSVWDAFHEHGIVIPYPQHEITIHQ